MDEGPEGEGNEPFQPPAPLQPVPGGGGLVVPSNEQFALARVRAKEEGTLNQLRRMIAARQAAAEKLDVVFEDLVRLVVMRLEVERDIGNQLAQTVKRGGDRANYPRGSLLPEDITWKQSVAYQGLASIPEDVFRAYVEHARSKHRLPSSAGARRFALPKRPAERRSARARRDGAVSALKPSAAALDAIGRVMTPDVVVGEAKIEAKRFMSANEKGLFDKLRGDVLVVDCPDPTEWLLELLRRRGKAQIRQVIAFVPAAPWEEWFEVVQESGVSCCFLRGPATNRAAGIALLHIGACDAAFRVAMAHVGVVVRA